MCEVPGALHTQGAALDAAAALCRYVMGTSLRRCLSFVNAPWP